MHELGISSIHPDAPAMFSAAAIMRAPIDVDAAADRFASLWGETIVPRWEVVDEDAGDAGRVLHFEVDGVHVLLTPVNHGLTLEKGQLPLHRFHVAASFFAPETSDAEANPDDEPSASASAPSAASCERDPAHGPAEEMEELRRRHRMVSAHVVFTEVMDALMREPAAIGVYRDELGVLMPPSMVTKLAELLTTGQAPLPLWVNVRVHKHDLTFGRTLGLTNFGHLDLQVRDSTRSEEEVYNLLMNVANYIVTGETYLLPSQTLGYTDGGQIVISQEVSQADGATVIRLDF
ncbi:DUF4261 domain-containing protein [Trueperella pecoris]|uniref:DUF4261 domain-containing protein n=1 Tax=Trueperella pecoris TaxID=2733571 RepID=UPI00186B7C9A|nr:DUF4261 domain-containing protein [Trueperella pecoris]QOQ39744.1 DUF4261 domain-containing protein [Trueperella pecoris]QTG75467.1 DUF4261 domain-containing protein [Trueperella pecoris]